MVQLAISGGKPLRTAPFHGWPVFDEAEDSALVEVLRSGKWWRFAFGQGVKLAEQAAGERSQVAMFQEEFARHHECRYGIAAANGTATLELGIRALEFDVGDEVIVPAYTYVASATCVLQNNLVPVFVDVDPDTYNIAPGCIEEAITSRTRAIMAVHFGGQHRGWGRQPPWITGPVAVSTSITTIGRARSAGRLLPLRLARESPANRPRIGIRSVPRDAHDGVILGSGYDGEQAQVAVEIDPAGIQIQEHGARAPNLVLHHGQ